MISRRLLAAALVQRKGSEITPDFPLPARQLIGLRGRSVWAARAKSTPSPAKSARRKECWLPALIGGRAQTSGSSSGTSRRGSMRVAGARAAPEIDPPEISAPARPTTGMRAADIIVRSKFRLANAACPSCCRFSRSSWPAAVADRRPACMWQRPGYVRPAINQHEVEARARRRCTRSESTDCSHLSDRRRRPS
jgi:hypothetical protein